MSKRNRPRRFAPSAVSVALAAAVLLGLCAPHAAAQRAKPAAAVNPKTAAVREATAEVLRETSEIRKLPILRPVRSGAQSRAEIEQMLVRNLDENSSPAELRASETSLKKFGLVPADFALRSFIINLLSEQVAGYYEPKTREFYLADWIDLDGQQPVMAHELTHALQDQHFNLRRFEDWPKHDSDAQLAAQSLVEGDATLLMMHYVVRSPMRQLSMLKAIATGGAGSTEQIDKAPRVMRETLVFPYTQGMMWAAQVYKRGGWELISKAYADLPKSTEQILHPEKYFAREEPLKNIALKDFSSTLGKGWKVADNDVNGEWGYFMILDQFLQSKQESEKAVAGWNGDRYFLYTGPSKGDVLIAQKTFWDTEEDAREFFAAYEKRTNKRYAVEPAETSQADRRVWQTAEGSVLVELSGKSVLILEGVPANVKAEALLKAL
ncbi:MAG TPA: hypothetical protein VM934_11490 [Pyrinomonadaceae bacterium]|jgi:hypothetical protein|nr:hypothetical protein [Pyrinomonadaceae bacterium]